ncbi:hypothetical protein N0V82_004384 [Gnomoniopsis sp. IMI 355080]|nr:hypothetical protein N0V82_004384 [Gnomoniopsis sp. IMI 355080]
MVQPRSGASLQPPRAGDSRNICTESSGKTKTAPAKRKNYSLLPLSETNGRGITELSQGEAKRPRLDTVRMPEGKDEVDDIGCNNNSTITTTEEVPPPMRRLTTPDLEFDYDRSLLKDPRPTPGRERRPRYQGSDVPAALAARRPLLPSSPPKPKGRLNAVQKGKNSQQDLPGADPTQTFHDLYKCRDKGREGSPTYDAAGFRLDYDKVMRWFRPVSSRRSMIKGMNRSVKARQELEERIVDVFFENAQEAKEKLRNQNLIILYLVKDTISKDLGVPWHKIGIAEVDCWHEKGFKKHKLEDWLNYSDEDKKRNTKMMSGASLRA